MTLDWIADPTFAIMATGALVGTAAALIGPFLLLRQNAMLSDAISHSIVFGIVMVWLLTGLTSGPVQILGAALSGVLTVWLTEVLTATGKVRDDAAIGLVFPDAHAVLLGEIGFVWLDVLSIGGVDVPKALVWMGAITLVNAAFVGLLWKELKLATFDPVLAQAFGFAPRALFYGLLFLTSGTAVAAFDAVGAILFIAFVIVPPATAYLLTDRLNRMVWIGIGVAIVSSLAGYPVAVAADVSIGGVMAVMTGLCLTAAFLFGPRHGILARLLQRRARIASHDCRVLVVHLMNHEETTARARETATEALTTHLGWPATRADAVLSRALAEGYVLDRDATLHLTERGRAMADAILRPWHHDAA
jgi:manganese/zinc/iron transport system permease protein